MIVFSLNEIVGQLVAVDMERKIAESKPRDLRDEKRYLVNPVNPV